MNTPSVNSRILKLEVLKDTATRTSVNAVESRTTSLESDVATAKSDISTLQGDVATLTQGIQDAVSTHNTSPDSHADIRTLIDDRALIEHQHARTDLPWITDPGAALLTAASASAQRTAIGMTAWAVAPWTDGTTSDIPEGTQLYFTTARADARIAAQKGQADGLAPLDAGGKVPTAHLPDSLTSFNGRTGAILPIASDYSAFYLGVSAQAADSAMLGGQLPSYYETAIGNPSANGYLLSSTTAGVRSWVAPYSHPATHAQSVIDSSTGWITTALAGKQPAGSYLTTSTNYAGSSSPGGAATTAQACTGNAATATKLTTARTLTIGSTGKTFDGSANVTWTLSEIGAVAQEVGTWTPGFSAATAPTGVTYSSTQVGKYVKTGVSCTIEFWVQMTSKGTGGSGNVLFTNLPFTAYNSTYYVQWKGPVGFIFNLTDSTDTYKLAWGVRDNSTSVYLGRNGGTYYNTQWSDLTNTTTVYGSLTYRTAS